VALHFVLDMDGTLGGMREVAELTARGDLSATIGRRYTLDEGPQACVGSRASTPPANSSSPCKCPDSGTSCHPQRQRPRDCGEP